jgi:hypothetical protein
MKNMELDVYVPEINLALEYQGRQHFEYTTSRGPSDLQMKRDEEKMEACAQHGILLLHVPFDWDMREWSIITMLQDTNDPIILQSLLSSKKTSTRKMEAKEVG